MVANTKDSLLNKIYTKLNKTPMARCIPLPPLIFRLAKIAPIRVSINTEKGMASLLYRSVNSELMFSDPRNFSRVIKVFKSGVISWSFRYSFLRKSTGLKL